MMIRVELKMHALTLVSSWNAGRFPLWELLSEAYEKTTADLKSVNGEMGDIGISLRLASTFPKQINYDREDTNSRMTDCDNRSEEIFRAKRFIDRFELLAQMLAGNTAYNPQFHEVCRRSADILLKWKESEHNE